ncbi:uncharacterized protein LOC108668627 [Hyalella azteca]|uniref:Uncharacterized protein LOC108668627 n=1 Tax=Hyalella azteca TaxID=294128 RepID=A0A8B7NCP0_HYAAZ|nr:uncharacterized protein LOC108668627 [Hyalella azteca]
MDKNQKCSIGDDSDAATSNAYSSPMPELRDCKQLPLRKNYHATGLQSSGIKPTLRRYHPVGGFNVPTVSAPRDIISNNFMVYHPTDGFYDFVEEEEIEEIYTETYAYDINANFVNERIPNPCERNLNPSLSARLGETCTPQENYLQSHSSFADLPEATSDVNDELLMETSDRIVSLPSTIVLSTPPTYQSSSNAIMFNRLNRAGYSPIGSRVGDTGPSSNTWIDASLAPHIALVNDDCASFAPMETCLSCQDFDTQEIHDGTRNTWNSISHRPESRRFSLSRLAPTVPMINSRIPIITYPSRQNAVERRSSLVYPMFDNTDCLPTETSEEDSGYLTNGPNINTLQVDRAFGGNINRHGSLIAADVKDKIHVKPRPSLASIARDCAGRKVHSPCPASSVTQHALTNEAETPDIGSNAFETDAVDDLDGSGRETSESGCDDQMEPGFYLDKHPICERDHGSERLAVSSLASSAKFTRPRLLPTLSPDVTFWKCVREGRLEDIGKKLSRIAAQYDVKLEQNKQAGRSSSEDLFDISVEIKCMRQLLQSLASDEHVQKIDSNLEVIVSSVRDWSVKGCETRAVTSGEAWCVCSLANSILERLGVRFHTEDLDQIPKGSNLNASSTETETNDLVINEKRSSLCNVANGKVSLATVPVEGFNTPCSTTARPTLTATQTFSSAAAPNSLSSEQRSSVALISILISRRLPFFKYQPLPGALPSPPLSEQQIVLAVVPLLLTSGQLALVVTILTGVTWYGGSHDVETKLRVFHETTSRLLHNPSPDDTYLNENMTSSLHPDKLGSSTSSYPQNCSGITFSSSNSQAPVMSSSSLPSASFVRKLLHRCRGEMLVCRLLQALVRSYRHDSLVLGHARYNRAVDLSHLLDDACERVLLSSNRLRRLHDSNTGLLHDEVEQLDQHVQRLRLTLRKLLLTLGTSGLTVSSRQRELIEATEDAELYSCEVTTVLEDLMLISPPHQKKTPTWPLPSDSRRMRPKPICRSLMTATIP